MYSPEMTTHEQGVPYESHRKTRESTHLSLTPTLTTAAAVMLRNNLIALAELSFPNLDYSDK